MCQTLREISLTFYSASVSKVSNIESCLVVHRDEAEDRFWLTMNTVDNRRPALICPTLSSFLIPYTLYSINIALPIIGKEFAMDAVLLNWAATSYLLSTAMFLVPLGKIADIYARKRVFALFSQRSALVRFSLL